MARRTLNREQARRFYDGFGHKQDAQAWYEDDAIDELLDHAGLEQARAVLELGCGTGRLAARILSERLPPDSEYLGVDISQTMLGIAGARLARFGDRARLAMADDSELPTRPGGWDRLLSTYVLDLLSDDELRAVLDQAHGALAPGGRICLAGVTPGVGTVSALVMGAWDLVHRISPRAVGGCRPIELRAALSEERWTVLHHRVVVAWGVASEITVAERRSTT